MSLETRLNEAEAERVALEGKVPELEAKVQAAKDAYANEENPPAPGSSEFEESKQAVAELGITKTQISDLKEKEAHLVALMASSGNLLSEARAEKHLSRGASDGDGWDTRALLADEGIQAAMANAAQSTGRVGPVELGYAMSLADVARNAAANAAAGPMAADVGATGLMRQGENLGVLPQVRRRLTLLDLIAQGTATKGNSLDYIEEHGSFDTAAAQVEGELKAEADLEFEDKNDPFATIAHWKKVQKQTLEDAPYIQSILDNRLRYGVFRSVETQIINGNGSAPNLRGIRNRSGIGATTWSGGDIQADKVLDGITAVILAEGDPTGIALYPTAWASMLKKKATGGDEQYISGGPFSPTPLSLWGYPIVPNTGLAADEALVGDWQMGAQLFWRTGIRVLMSDSDGDDFRRNRITLLAELRCGLAVYRPAWFNLVELA